MGTENVAQQNFNKLLTEERVIIGNAFGHMERPFPVTRGEWRVHLGKIPKVVVPGVILNNVAKYLCEEEFDEEREGEQNEEPDHDLTPVDKVNVKILFEFAVRICDKTGRPHQRSIKSHETRRCKKIEMQIKIS